MLTKKLYTSLLYNNKIKKADGVFALKSKCEFSELCEISDKLNESSILYKYFFANPLPSSYEELGYVNDTVYISASSDLIREVNWTILSLRRFKSEINLFLEYKKIY